MFFVWDTNGIQRPHIPGARGAKNRRVEQVAASHRAERVEKDTEHSLTPGTKKRRSAIAEYTKESKLGTQRSPAILAEAIMSSPVVSLQPQQSVFNASALFKERRFRHIPIVSEQGALVGILSDRDVLRETLANENPKEVLVESIMATEVLSARPETSIRDVARLMFEERIGGVPIVDEHGELVGMVTRADILRAVVNEAPLELWI